MLRKHQLHLDCSPSGVERQGIQGRRTGHLALARTPSWRVTAGEGVPEFLHDGGQHGERGRYRVYDHVAQRALADPPPDPGSEGAVSRASYHAYPRSGRKAARCIAAQCSGIHGRSAQEAYGCPLPACSAETQAKAPSSLLEAADGLPAPPHGTPSLVRARPVPRSPVGWCVAPAHWRSSRVPLAVDPQLFSSEGLQASRGWGAERSDALSTYYRDNSADLMGFGS